MIPLAAFEEIIDASGAAPRIEAMPPIGVRPRQLSVHTLLAGMCLTQADHRPVSPLIGRLHRTVIPPTAVGGQAAGMASCTGVPSGRFL